MRTLLSLLLFLPLTVTAQNPPCFYTSYVDARTAASVISSELDAVVIKRVVKNSDTAFYLDFSVVAGGFDTDMDTAHDLSVLFKDGTEYTSNKVASTVHFSKMIFYRFATLKVDKMIETLFKSKTIRAVRLGPIKEEIDEYNAVNLPIWIKCLMR